ncbi:hypothetical protein [Actinopolyspora mortivallis]|uniref:hypothetical protein n=1 Tax=Actinopolyspora mortivallis TaxID=33906 RepID=UPI00036FE884|nr:hypothetical protein [Actinopolyspora mortivallis]
MSTTRTAPPQREDVELADPRQLPDDGLGQSPGLETIWLRKPHPDTDTRPQVDHSATDTGGET